MKETAAWMGSVFMVLSVIGTVVSFVYAAEKEDGTILIPYGLAVLGFIGYLLLRVQ